MGADTLSIREDLTTFSTEALAKRLNTFATASYGSDQRVMLYLVETLRRVAILEREAPRSVRDRLIARQRREMARENAE